MANFDLAQYSTVADRIGLFAAEFPEFRIETSEFDIIRDGQNYIRVKVYIYKHKDDVHAWTSGISEERASKPFAIETAETSAFGRALANANYAAKLDSPRASREEMQRVNEHSDSPSNWRIRTMDNHYPSFRDECSHIGSRCGHRSRTTRWHDRRPFTYLRSWAHGA